MYDNKNNPLQASRILFAFRGYIKDVSNFIRQYIQSTVRLIVLFSLMLCAFDVSAIEEIITKCRVINIAYAKIEPFGADRSFFKAVPTEFITQKVDKLELQEEYWLTYNEKLPLKYNIYYKSKVAPDSNWDVLNDTITNSGQYHILNASTQNLVLNLIYPRYQQQTYYFNLDANNNGYMSMTNTRWSSFVDTMNNQSLYFSKCKGIK